MNQNNQFRSVLTGATGGIGKAMAFSLAPRSRSMLLLGRNTSALNGLKSSLQIRFPELTVDYFAGDLLDPEFVKKVEDYATHHQINLLINNAGINSFGAVTEVEADTQEKIIQTNLLIPMRLTQALLPGMLKLSAAQIIQIGSIFGYIGYPGNSAYCASKFGLRGYSQALARELVNSTVKVKYLAPRATATAINKGAVDQLNQALGTTSDPPLFVASQLLRLLDTDRFDLKLGFQERIFVMLNQLLPRINDIAIRKQLPTIEKYWSKS